MKNSKPSVNKTYVFTRIRPTSAICSACRKPLVRMVKVSDMGQKTQNFMYVCTNPNCSQKVDIHQLKKSGWELF